jgi:hypothetical protein
MNVLSALLNCRPILSSTALNWKNCFRLVATLAISVVGSASCSFATTITITPAGLAPGAQYRLAFVTNGSYQATSTDIATYNTDVNNEANNLGGDSGSQIAALNSTWSVIGSTSSVNAIDNIAVAGGASIPIYNLLGQLVATGDDTSAGALFNGSLPTPIQITPSGSVYTGFVFTGTGSADGIDRDGATFALGGATPLYGLSTDPPEWASWGNQDASSGLPLYAISGIITVGSPTPEPSTVGIVAMAMAILALAARKKQAIRSPK